jgi:uncharacterized protein (DUF1499 family)
MSQLFLEQNAFIRVSRRAYKPVLALSLLAALAGCSGSAPANLGVQDGRLAPCPTSPNCVNSQAGDSDKHIAPLPLKGDRAQTQALLVKLLSSEPRVTLVEQKEHYLRAEFASKLLGFVDDVEFLIGEQHVDVRSASRLGYSDFDVNRKRIEQLRQRLSE